MEKRLLFIRHAKSAWDNPKLSDHQRPLAPRGIKNCKTMVERHANLLSTYSAIYCSTAERTKQTLHYLQLNSAIAELTDELYSFDEDDVLSFIKQLDENKTSVILIGHNPAFEFAIEQLTGTHFSKFPTCAFAEVIVRQCAWKEIELHQHTLKLWDTPKHKELNPY